jgi:hypothetical protein
MLSSTLPNALPVAHGKPTLTRSADNIPTQQHPLREDPDPRPHPPARPHHPEIPAHANTCPPLAKKERHVRTVPTFKARKTDNAHAQASKPLTNKTNCGKRKRPPGRHSLGTPRIDSFFPVRTQPQSKKVKNEADDTTALPGTYNPPATATSPTPKFKRSAIPCGSTHEQYHTPHIRPELFRIATVNVRAYVTLDYCR